MMAYERCVRKKLRSLFEYLDTSTILFSFRYVCKRFQIIVNSYDQYKLDMRLISKSDFDHICHIISPEKILSIILTNDGLAAYYYRASAVVQVLITLRENIVTAETNSLHKHHFVCVHVYHSIIDRTHQ